MRRRPSGAPERKSDLVRRLRTSLLALATAAAVLATSACGDDTKAPTSDAIASVTVSGGDAKADPTITVPKTPLTVTKVETKVLTEGTGSVLTAKDLLSINAAIVNGKDGKLAHSTFKTGAVAIDLSDEQLFPSLRTALVGLKVGSRVLVASPPKDAFGEAGNEQLGFAKEDTALFLIDIVSATTPLATATGTPVAPKVGLPTVKVPEGKRAEITVVKGAKGPVKTVVQPLIAGQGAKTKAGQTVRVNYTGALWKDGIVFDSSADRPGQPFEFQLGAGKVIKGWDTSLVGQNVGSRLLIIVPPADGYGAAGSPPKIGGTDTLVFVVDILAAY
jgi:peptidylprolyl isomerase